MSVQTQLKSRGWYLEHRDGGHFKFYTVIVVEDGTVVHHWGKIGTKGQHKIQKLSPSAALTNGMRKVAEKHGKGYEFRHEDIAFPLDERDVDGANGVGRVNPDPGRLTLLFDKALRDPKFTGDKEAVLVGYDAFLDKAQKMMDSVSSPLTTFESVSNDFDELKASWAEIDDRHSLAKTTLEMTGEMLMTALMNGKL